MPCATIWNSHSSQTQIAPRRIKMQLLMKNLRRSSKKYSSIQAKMTQTLACASRKQTQVMIASKIISSSSATQSNSWCSSSHWTPPMTINKIARGIRIRSSITTTKHACRLRRMVPSRDFHHILLVPHYTSK